MSGQGPYFGQAAWFNHFHSEKLPSAAERYENEMKRVASVIDGFLKKNGTDYLIGNDISYADIAFITWNTAFAWLLPNYDLKTEQPTFDAWRQRMMDRPKVKKVFEDKAKASKKPE